MSVLAEIAVFPMDKGGSVSQWVARVLGVIQESGLPYQLGPMGTTVEGERAEVMQVADRCLAALEEDCDRVYMTLKVDLRKGPSGRMAGKVASVQAKLRAD